MECSKNTSNKKRTQVHEILLQDICDRVHELGRSQLFQIAVVQEIIDRTEIEIQIHTDLALFLDSSRHPPVSIVIIIIELRTQISDHLLTPRDTEQTFQFQSMLRRGKKEMGRKASPTISK